MKKNLDDLDYYVENLWESQAKTWCRINDLGYNVGRDHFLTPKFLSLMPSVKKLVGLDFGCGDGYNTHALTTLGTKKIYGLDISPTMIERAQKYEDENCQKLEFVKGSILKAPFDDEYFDFLTSFFAPIFIPNYEKSLKEVYRTLKPGGFFQFSITHPCFWTHKIQWANERKGVIATKYAPKSNPVFGTWGFENVPKEETSGFATYLFRRTFTEWLNGLVAAGLYVEKIEELVFPKKLASKYTSLKGFDKLPFFVIIRARKTLLC